MFIPEKTDAEKREEKRQKLIIQTAQAVHHLAVTMAQTNAAFWSVDAEQLVEDMNADVERFQSLLNFNTTIGQAVNDALDELNSAIYNKRAPLEIGNSEITFEDGEFIYTPTPEEVEELEE